MKYARLTVAELPGPRLERMGDDTYRFNRSRHRVLIAVLAIYLFVIGVLLNRIADNLDDCSQNVKTTAGQAEDILPGVERINQTGGVVVGALPLLVDGAERIAAQSSTPEDIPETIPAAIPAGVGYLDAR
jgi:hypothetical protein